MCVVRRSECIVVPIRPMVLVLPLYPRWMVVLQFDLRLLFRRLHRGWIVQGRGGSLCCGLIARGFRGVVWIALGSCVFVVAIAAVARFSALRIMID